MMKKTLVNNILLRLVKALDTILMTVPFALCWFLYYMPQSTESDSPLSRYMILVLFAVLYVIYGKVYDAFLISYYRISEMIYSQMLAVLIVDGISYLTICMMAGRFLYLMPGILCIIGQFIISILWSVLVHRWYFAVFAPKKTVIIYDMREGMEKLISEYGMTKKFQVLGTYQAAEALENMSHILSGIDCIFLAGVHSHERNIFLKYCVANGIRCYVIPRLGDVIMSGAKSIHMFHLPVLWVGRYEPSPEYLIMKRFLDIVVSGAALVILSPVMLISAIAIRTDGGPALYKQTRLTKNGKEFMILKFRSMIVDAEKDGVARLSTGEKDDRITPVGRFIRRTRIDELPQLINVLLGDMSIVGPRPERPEIARLYEEEMPEFALRLQAKAGLTGLAQVYGQYNTTPYDKLNMDLMYLANPGIMQDLRICFATVKILFLPDSAEGVAEGQTTAMDKDMKNSK